MEKIDCIVLVMRQSPDWESLSQDYEAGLSIDTSRYKPPGFIEGFPNNIETCIQTWNELFPVNFFRCRQTLKDIAAGNLSNVKNAITLSEDNMASLTSLLGRKRFLLFFHDDDDWFAPDTFEKVATLDLGQNEIAAFPLVKFDVNSNTCVRPAETPRIIVGERSTGIYRFQTNNYGINQRIALADIVSQFKDHVAASHFVDAMGIKDTYFADTLISATNKTPCSASKLPGLIADPQSYTAAIHDYIENLETLSIPVEMNWCKPALAATVALFRSLL